MADGKRRDDWDRASLIAAQVTNAQCASKKDMLPMWRFHPYLLREMKRKKIQPIKVMSDPKELAAMFGVA